MDQTTASDDEDTIEFEIEVVSSSSSESLNEMVDKIDENNNNNHHQHDHQKAIDVNSNQTNLPDESRAIQLEHDANELEPGGQKERQFNEVELEEANTGIEIINQLEVVVKDDNQESIASLTSPLVVPDDQPQPVEKPLESAIEAVDQQASVATTVHWQPIEPEEPMREMTAATSANTDTETPVTDQQVEPGRASGHNLTGIDSIESGELSGGREIPLNLELDLDKINENDKEAAELSVVEPATPERPAEVEVILVEQESHITKDDNDKKQIDLTKQPSDDHLKEDREQPREEEERDHVNDHQQGLQSVGDGDDDRAEKETPIESGDVARDANQVVATDPQAPEPQQEPVELVVKTEPACCPQDWSIFQSSGDLLITQLNQQPTLAVVAPRPLQVPPDDGHQADDDARLEPSLATEEEEEEVEEDIKAANDPTGELIQFAQEMQEAEQPPTVDIQLSSSPPDRQQSASPPPLRLDVKLAGRQRRLSVVFGGADEEDLEREFDEEPEFEQRQVQVKQNKNPRDEYTLAGELGRGRFGTVYRCTEAASGRQLAAKFVHMRRDDDRQDVEREVRIMSILQHKRLLQLYDAFDDGHLEMCLITELVEGGELFERIVDDDFELTEKKAAIFMRQICEGVAYMHGQNIVHLDMKPENILCISRTGNRIKLIDFGLARQLSDDQPLRVMFGTPDFAAPEVLGYELVTLATDMWSVGVICYVLLSGLSPFMGDNDMETMANVTRAVYDFDSQAFEPISDLAKDFISKLLLRNPADRLKPAECLQHPWLARGGAQLEAAVRERRESVAALSQLASAATVNAADVATPPAASGSADTTASLVSLDKRNLKKYVVRRKWHKTVHAIMALGRMGAFKQLM